jgi:hypothetical protein
MEYGVRRMAARTETRQPDDEEYPSNAVASAVQRILLPAEFPADGPLAPSARE